MTFYFYDLETSGFSPRSARIMQFAGQRTNLNLKPIGRPDNILVKLSNDILPDPGAILTHGITPQKTLQEGISEAEFTKYLTSQVFQEDTISVGYNNIRFDDEFMRFTLWRNFHDAYEWQWKHGNSRWDLLDVVRMMRALRPDGIKWPFETDGKPSNKLEYISSVNNLVHDSAHDALSDVQAVIAVAQMVKGKQPKLFDYLLKLRDKNKVAAFVEARKPFVYTSGRYSSDFLKTTVVSSVARHPDKRGSFVFDLRTDPATYIKMPIEELAKLWKESLIWRPKKDDHVRGQTSHMGLDVLRDTAEQFPIKLLAYNKSPAIGPMSVLDEPSSGRLKLDLKTINNNFKKLSAAKDFEQKILKAYEIVQPKDQPKLITDEQQVDSQLYDGFVSNLDRTKMSVVRTAGKDEITDLDIDFADERLKLLLPLYKARNFPQSLSSEQQELWEMFRRHRLLGGGQNSQAAQFSKNLSELLKNPKISKEQKELLQQLKIYAESIIPL